MQHPGQEILDQPGILGLIGRSAEALDGRVLVTDDRAHDLLVERASELRARVVYVFDEARACSGVMAQTGGYRATPCTAMVCSDLRGVSGSSLPGGLSRRPVHSDDEASIALPEAA